MLIPRELGEIIPISIPTALAVESFLSPTEARNMEFSKYDLWINAKTLFRNLYSTIENPEGCTVDDLLADLLEEHTILTTILDSHMETLKGKYYFYSNHHRSLVTRKLYKTALLKEPSTEKQKKYAAIEVEVVNAFVELLAEKVYVDDVALKGQDRRGVVITHQPFDLLSRYKFSDLVLLESHTGTFKRPVEWNTKLTGGSKNLRIPFNALTLQVFGDNSTMFKTYPTVVKRLIHGLSEERKWSGATTIDKIKNDLFFIKKKNVEVYNILTTIIESGKAFL